MSTLATTVDGLKLANPFIIGSGPPGTNLNVINRAFREGWGAVIAKTISLDSSKVVNVTPRYAKLMTNDAKEVVGWENIELISDRPFKVWIDEFKQIKDKYPDRC
ncbi:MAG: NAD-dependent dihydropyrimidine dehydrogenase subunit PreA, partial [Chthoniobacterales bacterium]